MPVQPALMELAALGGELITDFGIAYRDREIAFRPVGDLNGVWDYDRIDQALCNLLGLAL